jgi:hypothetical protein
VTASELAAFLQSCAATSQQTPGLGMFSSQAGGEFFFKLGPGSLQPKREYLRVCAERRKSVPATQNPCDVNGDGITNVLDIQVLINETLGGAPCEDDLTGLKRCTVIDVQRVVNAAMGNRCHLGTAP